MTTGLLLTNQMELNAQLCSLQTMLVVMTTMTVAILDRYFIGSQVVSELKMDQRCISKKSCSDCISSNPLCAWCDQEEFGMFVPRCDTRESLLRKNCSEVKIVNPQFYPLILRDQELSNAGAKSGKAVQIKPQKIQLRVRPHQVVTIPVTFRQAEEYPVDLYFLMDLTYSMRDDKEKLAELGDLLASSMANITSNFRLGFGSFVDKVLMPYVNTAPERLLNPCLDGKVCVPPYGYRNHLSLSSDGRRFAEEVQAANVSANLDDAEGGFDAIMQTIVCKDQIKWSDKSRKIVVFATDSGFHYAGDGKIGGVVQPNDELCHLDDRGYYTKSSYQDYPSLPQINRIITENKINMIFAVPDEVMAVYDRLSLLLEGATTGLLEKDSSNIVQLIQNQYDKIRSSVELKHDFPENVTVNFFSKCLGNKMEQTHVCSDLKVGNTVSFDVKIYVSGCPPKPTHGQAASLTPSSFHIYPVGLSESLEVELDVICECDCEKKDAQQPRSEKCSGNGTYECGVCNCYNNRFGRHCECDNDDINRDDFLQLCRTPGSNELCSGRGDCICGVCYCWSKDVDGAQCECDKTECDRNADGLICGGPLRGQCECGECQCEPGWSGTACDCRLNDDACIAPNGLVCSGNGACECGLCKCHDTADGRFSGPHCEDCPTCKGKCNDFKACVQCQAFSSGDLNREQCANCSFQSIVVDNINFDSKIDKRCIFADKEDCTFNFAYRFDSSNMPIVRVHGHKECPKPVSVVAVALGLMVFTVIVGLIILIAVRVAIYVKDSRDFAKFEKEAKSTPFRKGVNPLYKEVCTEHANPMYNSNEVR